jgi:hypothetical protein
MPANAELSLKLSVFDNSGAVTRDGVLVRSALINNLPPIANAGSDKTISVGATMQLDGSASSDPDGEVNRSIWLLRSGPTIQINNNNSATPNFIANTAGDNVLRLIVEDDLGARVTDDVQITVEEDGNQPPIAVAGQDVTHLETRNHQFNGNSSSDSDGSIVSYLWEQISGPSIDISESDASKSAFSVYMPEVDQDTELRFRLTVTDNGGLSSSDELAIMVLDNLPPQPLPVDEVTIVEGNYHVLDVSELFSFQQEDGFLTTTGYQWRQISGPSVLMQYRQYHEQVRILAPLVDDTTDLIYEITVEDRFGLPAKNTLIVHIINSEDLPPNIPPVAIAGDDRIISSKNFIIVDGSNSYDEDGEILSYEWSVIDSENYVGKFRGDDQYTINHAYLYEQADYTLRLTVTDDKGAVATDDVTITFNPYSNLTDNPPDADAGTHYKTPFRYYELGDSLSLNGSGSTDENGSIVSYQWRQLSGPKVDIANPASARTSFVPQPFDGTATSTNPIEYRFLLTVTDDEGDKDDSYVRHQVYLINREPYANFKQQPLLSLAGSTAQLDATRSYDLDPNDYISVFHWQQISGPSLTFLDSTVKPKVVLPQLNPQIGLQQMRIGLDVEDMYGLTSNSTEEYNLWVVSPDYDSDWFDAGDDKTVMSGNQIEITGETLTDDQCIRLEGCTFDSENISWMQLAGPDVEFIQDSGMTLSFIAPQVTERETLVLGMAYVDKYCSYGKCNSYLNDVDLVKVTVVPEGAEFVAVAGNDQELEEFTQAVLDGSGSYDSSGEIVKYQWKQLDGLDALISDSTATITDVLLPTVSEPTMLLFELTVTNDLGEEAVDTLSIKVLPNLDDGDIDGDGVLDEHDHFPDDPTEAYDFDGDGVSDNADQDYDGDGVTNDLDFYPNDPDKHAEPLLTVISPIDNSDIDDDYVIVRGTFEAPANSGITVNGIVAEITGIPIGSEFAARIPLEMNANELNVKLTTVSNKQISQTLTVNRTGTIPYKFYVLERNGVDQITNQLKIINTATDQIIQAEIDFEGDGAIDLVLDSDFEEPITHIYDVEGIHIPKVTITDINGMQYVLGQVVNVVSSEIIDQLLKEQWALMNDALLQGNHKLASDFVIDHEKDAYGEVFYLLLPSFSTIIQSYSDFQTIKIRNNYASFILNRDIDGIDRAFIVTYLLDMNGVWRLSGM